MELAGEATSLISAQLSARPSSVFETSTTREAVTALIDHTNEEIFAWLKFVRSTRNVEPISEQRPGNTHFSSSQIRALVALKDCPNERLLACFELARRSRNDPNNISSVPASSTQSVHDKNPLYCFEQRDPSYPQAHPWLEDRDHETSRPVLDRYNPQFAAEDFATHQPVRAVNSASSRYVDNHYWCTVCETPNSYKDSGNWKKHEKEHETVFVCGLDQVIADGGSGQKKRFQCKRRDIMVNHLQKSHGISASQQGRDLADKWRITINKQAWSCGFCVKIFLNFQDRLKHIDIEHFKKFESIQAWDFNKLIHGLLLQPAMVDSWKKRTTASPSWTRPEDLVWDQAFAKNIRTKLEVGPQNESEAYELADTIYSASKPNEPWKETPRMPITVGRAGGNPLSPSDHGHMVSAQDLGYHVDHRPTSLDTRVPTVCSEYSPFSQLPEHAYGHDNTTIPTMPFLDEVNPEDYCHPPLLYPPRVG